MGAYASGWAEGGQQWAEAGPCAAMLPCTAAARPLGIRTGRDAGARESAARLRWCQKLSCSEPKLHQIMVYLSVGARAYVYIASRMCICMCVYTVVKHSRQLSRVESAVSDVVTSLDVRRCTCAPDADMQ